MAAVQPHDLPYAVRSGRTPAECVSRLQTQVRRRIDAAAANGPNLAALHGYGAAKDWGLALAADIAAVRNGMLKWADIGQRAALLSGPPGTGKTSFAAALAKAAGIPLIRSSVSDWNAANYLSGTLQAMQSVFDRARDVAPAVLLLDELDGISRRDAIGGEYDAYWLQIINQLLTLLSDPAYEKVIIIGATNYPDRVDPALLRSGRIDAHFAVALPSIADLRGIFAHHLTGAVPEEQVAEVAVAAFGCSGADAAAIVKAARSHARRAEVPVALRHLLDEIERRFPPADVETRKRIAIHEAGHAIVAYQLRLGVVRNVSIQVVGGGVQIEPQSGKLATRSDLISMIAGFLAGRVAEEVVLGCYSVGAGGSDASDLAMATQLALEIETLFGMGVLGSICIPNVELVHTISNPLMVRALQGHLKEAEDVARGCLNQHLDALDRISQALVRRGYLDAGELLALLENVASPRELNNLEHGA